MSNTRGKALWKVLQLSRAFCFRPFSPSAHLHNSSEPSLVSAIDEIFNETSTMNNPTFHTMPSFNDSNHEHRQDPLSQSSGLDQPELSHLEHRTKSSVNANPPVNKDEAPQSIRLTDQEYSQVPWANQLLVGENHPVDKDEAPRSIRLTHREYSQVSLANELLVGENHPVDKDEAPQSIRLTDREYSHVQHENESFIDENPPVNKDEASQSIRLTHREYSQVPWANKLLVGENPPVDKDEAPRSIGLTHREYSQVSLANELLVGENHPVDKDEEPQSIDEAYPHLCHLEDENESFIDRNCPVDKVREGDSLVEYRNEIFMDANGERSIRKHLSRVEIEKEIGGMIMNIVAPAEFTDAEPILLVDGYAHMDILFEKLNKADQTIFDYINHNYQLYSYGADLKYIIQSYSTAYHLKPENWSHYSAYMDSEVVYGACGIQPFYADQYDLSTELNLRKALSHKRILALGEIGLDYKSAGRPSAQLQQKVFFEQLQLAKEFHLPIMLISRGSFLDTLNILMEVLDSDYMINWRNFDYSSIELNMVTSKFRNIHFGCSPYHLTNINLQKIIRQVDISKLLPESVCPHLQIPECPHIFETHSVFVIRIYQLISDIFRMPLREVQHQLLKNFKNFYNV